jgi:hypothetical protein
VTWLKEGDQNTNYFHRKASGRKRKNKISKLRKPDGSMTENETSSWILLAIFSTSSTKKTQISTLPHC